MAVITTGVTQLGDKRPNGRYFEVTWAVPVVNSASATEWISTGLHKIVAVLGHAVQGATDRGVNFVINAQGTGGTDGDSNGDLGIEATGAATVHVTVLGR